MKTNIEEILDGVFRLSLAPNDFFEFNQFLIMDESICLVHTGKVSFFENLKEMTLKLLGSRKVDYIIFSHFEADECGSVNLWLDLFPEAKVVCNKVANINLGDFLSRPATVIKDEDILKLGKKTLRLVETPHFPHNWDAHMWFEESEKALFSSDFCCHGGVSMPIAKIDNSEEVINFYVKGGFIPYGKTTLENLEKIESLNFSHLIPMHGSVLKNNLAKEVFNKVKEDLIRRGE